MNQNGRKLTSEEKSKVIELGRMGKQPKEIAQELGLNVQRVTGVYRTGVNSGVVPKLSSPQSQVPIDMTPTPAPTTTPPPAIGPAPVTPVRPAPPPTHVQAPNPPTDNRWTAAAAGQASTYALPTQTVSYSIYRLAPQNDGLVGTQTTDPSDEELGNKYGQGSYRIVRQIPGRMPEQREAVISAAFGMPRYPRNPNTMRTGLFGQPIWGHRPTDSNRGDGEGDEGRLAGLRPRPAFDDDRTLRPAGATHGETSVAVAVVEKLSSLQEKTLERMEDQAKRGPDEFIRSFYESQQQLQQKNRDEERAREADRRRDDEERHKRWEQDQEARHRRDMERIKEERETLLALEQKRIDLIREEAKAREEMLKREMQTAYLQAKEAGSAAEDRITEMTAALEKRLEEERSYRDRELDLRKQAMETEHALRGEMLKLHEAVIKAKGSENLGGVLGQVAEAAKATITQLVELKKFENMSPEDRATAMARQQAEGQVPDPGAVSAIPAPQPKIAVQGEPSKVPAATVAPRTLGGTKMNIESVLRESMKSPVAQMIFSEWAMALQVGGDPAMFSNTFFEWLKDDSPDGAEARKACSTFAQLMDIRDWPAMKALIYPALPEDIRGAFDLSNAEPFYNTFKLLVCEQIKDYARMYLEQKRQEMEARKAAAGGSAVQPKAEAPANGNGSSHPPAETEAPETRMSEPEPEASEEPTEESSSEIPKPTA